MVTAFKKVEGVTDASADCKKGSATVTFDPAKTNVDTVLGALKGTKYTASKQDDAAKKGS